MDKRRNPLRDPAPFRAWLEELPPGAPAGRSRMPDACPLASYVRELRGDEFVRVHAEAFVAGDQYFALPKWAQRFVQKVDASWRSVGVRVAAGYALTLLAEVEAGGS